MEKSDIKSNSTWYFVTFRGHSSTKLWKKKELKTIYLNASLNGWRSGYVTSIQILCAFSLLNSAKTFFCWQMTSIFRIHWDRNHPIFKTVSKLIMNWQEQNIISTQAKIFEIWQEQFLPKKTVQINLHLTFKANSILLTFAVSNLYLK